MRYLLILFALFPSLAWAEQACMPRADIIGQVKATGLTAAELTAEQNEHWRSFSNTHTDAPDPEGFTYVFGWGPGPIIMVVGFDPNGCFSYWQEWPKGMAMQQAFGDGI